MFTLKTVLVATDFSRPSQAALAYGRELARTFDAKLTVLHVADNIMTRYAFEGVIALTADVQIDYENAKEAHLNQLLHEDDRRELGAQAVLRTSNVPADAIVEYARDAVVDIIVLGTNGRRALPHMLLGSVAERVVRFAPCPVLTVRSTQHEFLAPDALVAVAKA
jgi:nucleotide-binding universal stress UspA family protein